MTEYPRDEISGRGGDPEAISDRYREQQPESISVSWPDFVETVRNEDDTIEYIAAIQDALTRLERRKRERDTTMPVSARWETDVQQRLIAGYAFAIPTREALEYLHDQGPLVELGAWKGYWAYELDNRGVEITAYDADPVLNPWFPVETGDQDVLLQSGEAETLVLCWPPVGPMAYEALLLHDGDVIYIGERPGDGFKAFADMRFFDVLDARYEHSTQIDLPSHPGAKDDLRRTYEEEYGGVAYTKHRLACTLFEQPYLTTKTVMRRFDVEQSTAYRAITALEDAGVLEEVPGGGPRQEYRAREIFDILEQPPQTY